ncbi:hypothetical protein ALC62_06869 [Cyphomyrmex costatus]|uniref:Uncharacterized protein n=1 Tax=Cyphomyrmex costatus TaxID=456900 RepID=A0A151IIE0_9HYME|nr:hypothetical protein ALC62_06869 [Cyphomyrmex costatus]
MLLGRRFSYRGMEKKAPAIQRHDTGQTEFLMGRSVIHGSTKSIVYDRGASPWTPCKLSCGVDRCCSTKTIEVTIQSSSENQYSSPAEYHEVPTRCSRRPEKRTLQYDLVFTASAETSNSRRAARQLRSEDELVLLICLTKRFRFFVNTANIGGFWYTRRERLWKKENSSTSSSFLASLGSGRSKEGRGRQARDAGMMANGCIARARRRDTDASPSGAKAKTAEWNYSCSIVYNGRINGLNRRRTTRSLFVIAQRSAAGQSHRLGSCCIFTISSEVYEPNIEEKLHPLMSQASWSLVTTGDGGDVYATHLSSSSIEPMKKADCDDFRAGAALCYSIRNARNVFCFDLKAIGLWEFPIIANFLNLLVLMHHEYNNLTVLSASNMPEPQTRPRLFHKGEPARPHSPLPLPLSQSATVPRKLERAPPFDPADSHPPSHPTTIHPSVDLTPSPMAPRSFPFPLPTKRIQLLPTVSFSATRYDISILAPCPRQHPFSRYTSLSFSFVALLIFISLLRMLLEDIG